MTDRTDAKREQRKQQRKVAQAIRRILGALAAAAVVGAIIYAWLPKPVAVDVARLSRAPFEVTIEEDGKTRVKDRYMISAPLPAQLTRISLQAGDEVSPGQVLAQLLPLPPQLLDPRSLAQAQARVAAATASKRQVSATINRVQTALDFAKREAARAQQLQKSGAVAESNLERADLEARSLTEELASARFSAKVAEQELTMAHAALGQLGKQSTETAEQFELPSPVKGHVLRVIQQSEGMVQPGTPLLEIGDPATLEVVVDVLTADAIELKPGTDVRIDRWGGDRLLRAHVRLVEPSAFTRLSALGVEEQRVNVIVDFDDPPQAWSRLGDGYRVEARMIVWNRPDVLQAPLSATFRKGDGWAVYAVRDGKARLIPVEIGHRNTRAVEIVRGLREGDTVVVHPGDRVADGVSVAIR
jgi:HlyD family secretion protein